MNAVRDHHLHAWEQGQGPKVSRLLLLERGEGGLHLVDGVRPVVIGDGDAIDARLHVPEQPFPRGHFGAGTGLPLHPIRFRGVWAWKSNATNVPLRSQRSWVPPYHAPPHNSSISSLRQFRFLLHPAEVLLRRADLGRRCVTAAAHPRWQPGDAGHLLDLGRVNRHPEVRGTPGAFGNLGKSPASCSSMGSPLEQASSHCRCRER